MLEKKAFQAMLKLYEAQGVARDIIIKEARDVLTASKKAIYAAHRDELVNARKHAASAKKTLIKITKLSAKGNYTGALNAAAQEYVEAVTYIEFLTKKRLSTAKDFGVSVEDYLLGLADLSGELVRRAVREATKKHTKEVERIHQFVDDLYGQMATFDFRNGELRKKADAIRWNLRKIEDLLYDLKR